MTTLKNGLTTEDPRLDRIPQFDERSRNFPVTTETGVTLRNYTWRCHIALNQGGEGGCVGAAIGHEFASRPSEVPGITYPWCRENIYFPAQRQDPWPGGAYPGASPFYEGTSELAGLKVAQALGYFDSYWWGFNLEQVLYGIGHRGPALFACRWDSTMYEPDPQGFIHPDKSRMVGYHLILINKTKLVRVDQDGPWELNNIDQDKSWVQLHNSWGEDWNDWGGPACRMTVAAFDELRADNATVSFALSRHSQPSR